MTSPPPDDAAMIAELRRLDAARVAPSASGPDHSRFVHAVVAAYPRLLAIADERNAFEQQLLRVQSEKTDLYDALRAERDALRRENERLRVAMSSLETDLLAAKHTNDLSASGKKMLARIQAALASPPEKEETNG